MFRSEQHVDRWCHRWKQTRGTVISPQQGWELATGWYHDRLDPDWKPKSPPEIRRLFEDIGLKGEFWKLP
jgi:hypothetical protein